MIEDLKKKANQKEAEWISNIPDIGSFTRMSRSRRLSFVFIEWMPRSVIRRIIVIDFAKNRSLAIKKRKTENRKA